MRHAKDAKDQRESVRKNNLLELAFFAPLRPLRDGFEFCVSLSLGFTFTIVRY